jgi:predicted GIY-YIG superfamily endonuclease/DNA-binding transcriptional ArsR family regulator
MTERTALYRLYDDQDRLLYIGIAKDPKRRWWQHARDSGETWWPDVARKQVQWFADRESAAEAEAAAIRSEGPPHNSQHVSGYDNPANGWRRQALPPSQRGRELRYELLERGFRLHRQSEIRGVSIPTLLAEKIRERIASGVYAVGSKIPTNSVLIRELGASQPSISRAIAQLKAEGLLEVRPAKGTFVIAVPK